MFSSKLDWFSLFFVVLMNTNAAYEEIQGSPDIMSLTYGSKCENILVDYANQTANFIQCFIRNARPIRVCQKCVTHYEQVRCSHENILNLHDNDTGEMCKQALINVDRLEVIERSFEYVINQWQQASCNKCFSNGSLNLNNLTTEILNYQNKTEICINASNKTSHSNEIICKMCNADYVKLNDFYDKHGSYNGFCMDVVDMMNSTRIQWSVELGCCTEKETSQILFLIIVTFLCCLPIILYFFIWFSSAIGSPEITYQERWNHRFYRLTSTSM